MHLAHLRLRDFRNYARLDVDFAPGFHLLLGDNAQGKTNILEAIYLIATLRSFRGVGGAQMVRHGQKGYFVGGKVVGQGEHDIKMYWSSRERSLSLDARPVRKLTDYLGALRTVVFCTEDLQLVKGVARARRRFLDLLLSQTYPAYLPLLQRYTRALRSRNALLKQPRPDPTALDGFSRELVKSGEEIIRLRRELVPRFSPLARLAYRHIASETEELRLEYQPSVKEDFTVELAQSRNRVTARAPIAQPSSGRIGTICSSCWPIARQHSSAARGKSARSPSPSNWRRRNTSRGFTARPRCCSSTISWANWTRSGAAGFCRCCRGRSSRTDRCS